LLSARRQGDARQANRSTRAVWAKQAVHP
jgi:hypothetical protein